MVYCHSNQPVKGHVALFVSYYALNSESIYSCYVSLNWFKSGSSNLHILHAHIKYHVAHKTKEECLKQLPGKTREFKTVPVASKYEIQHNKALTDLVSYLFKSLKSCLIFSYLLDPYFIRQTSFKRMKIMLMTMMVVAMRSWVLSLV